MRALLGVMVFAASVAWAQTAPSPTSPPLTATEEAPPVKTDAVAVVEAPAANWSFGAGVGYTLVDTVYQYQGTLSAGLGGLIGAASAVPQEQLVTAPSFALAMERRVTPSTWLALQGSVSHDSTSDDVNTTLFTTHTSFQISLGARYVFNVGGAVEVSGFVSAGFRYGASTGSAVEQIYDSSTNAYALHPLHVSSNDVSLAAQVGFALQRKLIDHLALRLSSSLFALSYFSLTSSSTLDAADPVVQRQHGFNVGVYLRPTLELRYEF